MSVEFASGSGSLLRGWMVPGEPGACSMVLMHGFRSDRRSLIDRARFLGKAGYHVLLFDFQGHGESDGDRTTFGGLERLDAIAAVEFVRARLPDEPVGCLGISMGGAAAVLAPGGLEVDALVLEAVFPTIESAIAISLLKSTGRTSLRTLR